MKGLKGKIAMITGGATGIGAAIVRRFSEEGVKVACCYNSSCNNAENLKEELSQKGIDIYIIKIDVLDEDSIKQGIRSIHEYYGDSIDILVNNAGDVFGNAPIDELGAGVWDKVIGINLKGAFLCTKYCLGEMKNKKSGRIINISSISAKSGGGPGGAHYASSKSGLEGFNRAIAKEGGSFGITSNAISPGVILTPIHERTNSPETLEIIRKNIPLKRLGIPEDVAGLAAFLASEDASYITGTVIPVNGGLRIDA